MIRSRKVLDHARNQKCQLGLPHCCNESPQTVVFCHLNGAAYGKAAGMKAHDIAGFFGCSNCHSYYDVGHGTKPRISDDDLSKALLKAVINTWVILINDGVIFVPQDAVQEHVVKPRKPKSERKAINSRPFPKQSRGWRKREE